MVMVIKIKMKMKKNDYPSLPLYSHTTLNAKHVNEANSINVGSNTSSLTTIRGVTPNNGIYVT